MTIRFSCPHCDAAVAVRDEAAGKSGQCRKCGQRFRVPAADAPDEDEFDDDFESSEEDDESSSPSLTRRRFNVTVAARADGVAKADLGRLDSMVRKHLRNAEVFRQVDLRVTVQVHDPGSRLLRYLLPLLPGASARTRIAIKGTLNGTEVDRTVGGSRHIGFLGGSSDKMLDECFQVACGEVLIALDRAAGRPVSSFTQIWNAVRIGKWVVALLVFALYVPVYYHSRIPRPGVTPGFNLFFALLIGVFSALGVFGVLAMGIVVVAPSHFYLKDARGVRTMATLGVKSVAAARTAALVLFFVAAGLIWFSILAYLEKS